MKGVVLVMISNKKRVGSWLRVNAVDMLNTCEFGDLFTLVEIDPSVRVRNLEV